ncbi:MAG: methyltransferase domain-containing protein [Candidatus Berkelbacteria bacterium]|nr:MAG: methyltransferase domain-containing protein [Candidatus Berkelbacteria bacterium]QQG51677.1 MAG: methyltransferase domain-containing protein [Candidatus Berkelbacteria bacterium]
MNDTVAKLLICPDCSRPLSLVGDELVCKRQHRFQVDHDSPVLLPHSAMSGSKWQEWEEKQEHGLEDYENPDPTYIALSNRVAGQFGEFCNFKDDTVVLDIGCGIEPTLFYVKPEWYRKLTFIGLDPLRGKIERPYHFVQAIAEKLPFKDDVFDQVVLATSLDHIIELGPVMKEIRRVLKPHSRVSIWITVFEYSPGRNITLASYLKDVVYLISRGRLGDAGRRFLNPYLAAGVDYRPTDQFHFHRFTRQSLLDSFRPADFRPTNYFLLEDHLNQGSKHFFLELGPANKSNSKKTKRSKASHELRTR